MPDYQVIIIGGGPAGVSAALYLARAAIKTLIIENGPGALSRAHKIDNYYGVAASGSELYTKGLEQAKELADAIVDYPIDYIYSSDLGRAVQTAQIIANKLNLDVNKTPALREMGFGIWEGLLIEEIKRDHLDTYKTWRNDPH